MRLNLKFKIGAYQVSLIAGLVTPVWGINSTLKDGKHITMWEFDEADYGPIRDALQDAQWKHSLPSIRVARSHLNGGYHAYCFTRLSFVESLHIVSGTAHVDAGFITMCATRRHWTLRLSDKGQGAPQSHDFLSSYVHDQSNQQELTSAVEYKAYRKKLEEVKDYGERQQ